MVANVTTTSISISWEPIECLQRNNLTTTIRVVITDVLAEMELGRVSVTDTGFYSRTKLAPGRVYSFHIAVQYRLNVGRNPALNFGNTASPSSCKELVLNKRSYFLCLSIHKNGAVAIANAQD